MKCTDGARPPSEPGMHTKTSHDRATPEDIPSAKDHPGRREHIACVNIRYQSLEPNSIYASCGQCQCPSYHGRLWSLNLAIAAKWTGRLFGAVRAMCLFDDDMLNIGFARDRHGVHRRPSGHRGHCILDTVQGQEQKVHEGILSGIPRRTRLSHLSYCHRAFQNLCLPVFFLGCRRCAENNLVAFFLLLEQNLPRKCAPVAM